MKKKTGCYYYFKMRADKPNRMLGTDELSCLIIEVIKNQNKIIDKLNSLQTS